MTTSGTTRALLFVDDGHPEAREYDDNYFPVDPHQPRNWMTFVGMLLRRRTRTVVSPAEPPVWSTEQGR